MSLLKEPVIRAVKSGGTTRFIKEMIEERYDSNDEQWKGYKELE